MAQPGRWRDAGFVLPAVLLALVVMSVIAVAAMRIGDDERRASRAMREVGNAFYAAEGGLNELRETVVDPATGETLIDSVAGTLDAGERADLGWNDLADGARYRGELLRCDDGTNPLFALTVEGKGRSGRQVLRMMLRPSGATIDKSLLVDGNLTMSGKPTFVGACADVHVNGNFNSSGTIVADGKITASGSVTGSAQMIDSNGDPVVPEEYVDSVEVPLLDPMDFCGPADFVFRNGWIVEVAIQDSAYAGSSAVHGWKYNANDKLYEADGPVSPGTLCVDGSVKLGKDQGAPGAPVSLTVLAQGTLEVTSEVYLRADHPDGVLFVTGGDMKISGGGSATAVAYDGFVYIGSQCGLSNKQFFRGQVICKDEPDPPGAKNLIGESKFSSETRFDFDCTDYVGGGGGGGNLKPLSSRAWIKVLQ